jgi:hypothetical protein
MKATTILAVALVSFSFTAYAGVVVHVPTPSTPSTHFSGVPPQSHTQPHVDSVPISRLARESLRDLCTGCKPGKHKHNGGGGLGGSVGGEVVGGWDVTTNKKVPY